MKRKLYRFAGLEFALSFPEDMMYDEESWLEPFRADRVELPHRYTFCRVDALPPPEGTCLSVGSNVRTFGAGERYMRYFGPLGGDPEKAVVCVEHQNREHTVRLLSRTYGGKISVSAVLDALDVNPLIIHNRGVILHASFIEWEGRAILFTAPCQTGKSTQARLWQEYRGAEIINGDRAVIRIDGDRILAEGLPFCGSSGLSRNRSLPLAAIVYLDQAPVTTIRRLRGYDAFARIWEGILVDNQIRSQLETASETVGMIARQIPIYHMPCTPDGQAVDILEKTLRKQESQ